MEPSAGAFEEPVPPVVPVLPPAAAALPPRPAAAPRDVPITPQVLPGRASELPAPLRRRRRRRRAWIHGAVATLVLAAILGGIGAAIWHARVRPTVHPVGSIAGGSTAYMEGDLWFVMPSDAVRSVTSHGAITYFSHRHDMQLMIFTIDEKSEQEAADDAQTGADSLAAEFHSHHTPPTKLASTGAAFLVHFTRSDNMSTDARFLYKGTMLVLVIGDHATAGSAKAAADVVWESLIIDGKPAITG